MENINRKVIISEEITEQTAERVISHICAINEFDEVLRDSIEAVNGKFEPAPIELIISSGGGSAHAGFAIIGAMEMSDTPIMTVGLGLVGSMALGIYVSGDIRVANNLTRFMYHSVAYGEMGKLQDHRDALHEVEILQETYDLLFKRATNLSDEVMKKIQRDRHDFHFSAEESVELGVSDSVFGRYEVECDLENPCDDCDCDLGKEKEEEVVILKCNPDKPCENCDCEEEKFFKVDKELLLKSDETEGFFPWKDDNGIEGIEDWEEDSSSNDNKEPDEPSTFVNKILEALRNKKLK